jgi:hypothetical protein
MRTLLLLATLAATAPLAIHAQWEIQNSGTTADLRGIHALGNGIAWASGTEGTVLRTIDNGANWQHCTIPPGAEKLDFRGVQGFDANTAIVMSSGNGELSRVYKTTDACANWKIVFTNPDKEGFFDALSFSMTDSTTYGKPIWGSSARVYHPDAERHVLGECGFLLGDPVGSSFRIFHTCDRGSTWQDSGFKFVAKGSEAAFAASNQSLVTMPRGMLFVTGGSVTRLRYNDDGCELDGLWCYRNIRNVTLPLAHGDESSGAFAMAILPGLSDTLDFPYTIVIVGGDYKHPEAKNGVAATAYFMGLRSFPSSHNHAAARAAHTPPHGYRSAVSYISATKSWITVGPNGTDISTDDGRNWSAVHPAAGEAADADRSWNALSLPFVVGPKGRVGMLDRAALNPQP